MTMFEEVAPHNMHGLDDPKDREDPALEYEYVRQTFVDAGKKGGSSPKRKERTKARNKKLIEEAQELLVKGLQREQLLFYFWTKYGSENGYPKSKRQYGNILRNLESG